jgi:hypothetical protein
MLEDFATHPAANEFRDRLADEVGDAYATLRGQRLQLVPDILVDNNVGSDSAHSLRYQTWDRVYAAARRARRNGSDSSRNNPHSRLPAAIPKGSAASRGRSLSVPNIRSHSVSTVP